MPSQMLVPSQAITCPILKSYISSICHDLEENSYETDAENYKTEFEKPIDQTYKASIWRTLMCANIALYILDVFSNFALPHNLDSFFELPPKFIYRSLSDLVEIHSNKDIVVVCTEMLMMRGRSDARTDLRVELYREINSYLIDIFNSASVVLGLSGLAGKKMYSVIDTFYRLSYRARLTLDQQMQIGRMLAFTAIDEHLLQ
jgi:hypothetical protein